MAESTVQSLKMETHERMGPTPAHSLATHRANYNNPRVVIDMVTHGESAKKQGRGTCYSCLQDSIQAITTITSTPQNNDRYQHGRGFRRPDPNVSTRLQRRLLPILSHSLKIVHEDVASCPRTQSQGGVIAQGISQESCTPPTASIYIWSQLRYLAVAAPHAQEQPLRIAASEVLTASPTRGPRRAQPHVLGTLQQLPPAASLQHPGPRNASLPGTIHEPCRG